MKYCGICKLEKDTQFFSISKSTKGGLQTRCKPCRADYYAKRKAYFKQQMAEYQKINKESVQIAQKAWAVANKELIRLKRRAYERQLRKTNLNYKLSQALRTRIGKALKAGKKSGSAVADLGCSIPQLREYLEQQFQPGMSWNNHGLYGWHIDHIMPLSNFNLSIREEFLKACHYTNLQPLWAKQNLLKSDKAA